MTICAVMAWDTNGHPTKFQPCETAEEAEAHVLKFTDQWPDAIVVLDFPDDVAFEYVTVDPATKTAVIDVARQAADIAAEAKQAHNESILAQIDALELSVLRPMRELRRNQEHADVPAGDVAFAKQKIKDIDDQITALRKTLQ